MYSSTLPRTAGGIFGDERIRLMTLAEGPILLSRLSTTQAVARHTPRTAACFAVVSYPAATKASRISVSFAACRAFASARDCLGGWPFFNFYRSNITAFGANEGL